MMKNLETVVNTIREKKNITIMFLCMMIYSILLIIVSANAEAKTPDDSVETAEQGQIVFVNTLADVPTLDVKRLEVPTTTMADYYKELYGPKSDNEVHVGKYSFEYIPGMPSSIYELKVAQIELAEVEEVVEISEEERFSENIVEIKAATITAPEVPETTEAEFVEIESTDIIYTPHDLMYHGRISWGGSSWTWYSEKVLPGGGLNIPGRHVDEDGFVCDENGYICLAADGNYIAYGTVIDTPLGRPGKIYDCGCDYGTVDVYVSW